MIGGRAARAAERAMAGLRRGSKEAEEDEAEATASASGSAEVSTR